MAVIANKGRKDEKDDVVLDGGENKEAVDTDQEPPKVEDVVVVTPTTVTATAKTADEAERKVKVRISRKHTCCIAGTWYVFEKGSVYTVSENVKQVLTKDTGLLIPV